MAHKALSTIGRCSKAAERRFDALPQRCHDPRRQTTMRGSAATAARCALVMWTAVGAGTGCRRDAPVPAPGPWRVTILAPADPAPPGDLGAAVQAGARAAGLNEAVWGAVEGPAAGLLGQLGPTPAAGTEVVVAISAAALSAAIASGRPTVFTGVADPAAAGATTPGWLSRWLPSLFPPSGPPVTGVSAQAEFDRLLELAGPLLPRARVGALQAPADADSLVLAEQLRAAAGRNGQEAVFESIAAPADAAAAIDRLCGARLGAVVALGDRSTDAALGAIADGARTCGVPLLGTRRSHAAAGALVTLARDERGAARDAGRRLAGMLRDAAASPPPCSSTTAARLTVNAAAAELLGIGLPLGLVEAADELLGEDER